MRKKTSTQNDSAKGSDERALQTEKQAGKKREPASEQGEPQAERAPARRPRRRKNTAEKATSKGEGQASSRSSFDAASAAGKRDAVGSVAVLSPEKRDKALEPPSAPKRRNKNRKDKDIDIQKPTDEKVGGTKPAQKNIDKKDIGNVDVPIEKTSERSKSEKNDTGKKNIEDRDLSSKQKASKNITGKRNDTLKNESVSESITKKDTGNKKAIDKAPLDSEIRGKSDTGHKKDVKTGAGSAPRNGDAAAEKDAVPQKRSFEEDSGAENVSERSSHTASRRSRRGGRSASRHRSGVKNIPDMAVPEKNAGGSIDIGIKNNIEPLGVFPASSASEPEPAVSEPDSSSAGAPRRGKRKKNPYPPLEYGSVQMMSSLRGFAPLGMLFVLMDVLRGREEGLIHINQLAQALSIGKPSLLAQLENLEAAGLLRTLSSSRMGRHVELLTPNQVRNLGREEETGTSPFAALLPASAIGAGADGAAEAGGQFSVAKLEALARYLQRRGVEIVSIPDESDLDPCVSQIAAFLGKYLSYVLPFYETLKATLNEGAEFTYSLAGLHGRDVTHTLNFCRMLQEVDFLASYAYRRAPHCKIVARVNRTPTAINFLTGGWLEHFIRDKVVSILTTHPATLDLPYAFMKNPRIILPGEEDFELDLLLSVGERIFWIEAKTGEYMDFLPKYSRVSKVLGLNRNTSMLVSVGALAPADNLSARYELSCCNLDEFADVFRINLVRELQQGSIRRRRG